MGDGDECAFLGTGLRHEGWPERNEPGGRIIWCTVERRDLSERLGDVTGVFDTEAEARDSLRTHPSPYAKTVERDMAVEPTASEAAVDAVWFENERGDS